MASLITPSPLLTDHRLDHHAPVDVPIAKIKPIDQSTVPL